MNPLLIAAGALVVALVSAIAALRYRVLLIRARNVTRTELESWKTIANSLGKEVSDLRLAAQQREHAVVIEAAAASRKLGVRIRNLFSRSK